MNNRRTKAEWRSRRETYLRESGRHGDLVAEGYLMAERRLFVVINGGRLVREHVEEVARSASHGYPGPLQVVGPPSTAMAAVGAGSFGSAKSGDPQ